MNYFEMLNERRKIKDQIFKLERETPDSERQEYKDCRVVNKDGKVVLEEYTFMSTPEIQDLRKKAHDIKVTMNTFAAAY